METTEPIQLGDITASIGETLSGMGLKPEGAKKIESIIKSHINKNAVLNNYNRRTLRFMLWAIVKSLYKDMTKNREQYGTNISKESIVSTTRNSLFLALNRGLNGEERDLFYGATVDKLASSWLKNMQNQQK